MPLRFCIDLVSFRLYGIRSFPGMKMSIPWLLALMLSWNVNGFSFAQSAFAPAYDHCSQAYRLRNVQNWCSSARQFTNESAGPSPLEGPLCFPGYSVDSGHDVWFVFTAIATTLNISVIGSVEVNPKGTLQNPQLALYQGSCNNLKEVTCISDYQGNHIVETFASNLIVGANYYIRVDGRFGRTGSFQLCLNNYNPIPSPSSDCSSAVVLCDKSSFTVPNVVGAGRNTNEVGGICLKEESSSAWYKWTCEKSGTLTFILTPVNPGDDLDFAVFLLPNGVGDCTVKVPLRCMASGENVNQPMAFWSKCTGATGLRTASFDFVENEGCDDNDDNFLAALQMEAGKSYALLVNNYHNTGNGFSIEFGGIGTFAGPKAHFTVNKLSLPLGEELYLRDASTFSSSITKWDWNFGLGATPQSARGKGLHKVNYKTTGKKSISLSIETSNGCKVTKVRSVQIKDAPAPVKDPVENSPNPVEITQDDVPVQVPAKVQESPGSESVSEEISEGPENEVVDTSFIESKMEADTITKVIELTVKYVATIYFKADSASLISKDLMTLEEVVELMNQYPDHLAIVEGYTNSIPSDDYSMKLASARADNVIAYLLQHGISEEKIVRKIYGRKRSPSGPSTYSYRKLYQKVEVRIVEHE